MARPVRLGFFLDGLGRRVHQFALDEDTGLEVGGIYLFGEHDRVDAVQAVGEGQVGGNLRLRVHPGTLLLLVSDEDRNGEHGNLNAEADSGRTGLEEVRRTEVRAADGRSLHEFLHHVRTSGCDVKGERQSASGDAGGDDVTLLVEDFVRGDILTFPGGAVLHNLAKGLRIREVGKFGGGIIIHSVEDDEVALSNKRNSCGINFVDNSCHIVYDLEKLIFVVHLKLRIVDE